MASLTSSRPTTSTHWHQDSPKPTMNEGTDDLQLVIDTRQALGKRPPHTNQDGTKSPTRPLPAEGKRTKRPVCTGSYASVIPQVNYTEGSAPNNPPRPARTLLKAPSHTEPASQTDASRSPPTYNGAPHTRKRPPEDDPQNTSKKPKSATTSGNGE